ncbi:DNA mismatch repair protein MutT [Acetobacter cibinongensis]|uniref:DNA mismatch repair protein MutT n=1 Tax=Acetobacter cibinongensis TaxID=146475 RepID=A0A0D6N6I4_9PROT|nr:NUDIX domain-containing protein [Acetobacter cibinongensis]GAN61647.1 phosphohydrolase [Acetobacter cibinongensis]GBQ19472.1 phosphohydrolase [Acetobacter cibinongensis NRIC 0482]GEL59881.1 DNA mismatch repair protein MutT [Acetobacter cibinongensis]
MTVSKQENMLYIATALIMNDEGHVLLVRKRGTTAFMQAGGKISAGETPIAALCRELNEELGLSLDASEPQFLESFMAPAAHEPGFFLEAQCYLVRLSQHVTPQAEIEEVIWLDPHSPSPVILAPLTRDSVLPLARQLRPSLSKAAD